MGLFKYESGRLSFIQASWMEWSGYSLIEIMGTEGYIILDNREPNCLTVLSRRDGSRQTFDYSRLPPQSYTLEMEDFVNSIIRGQQPQASGFDGLRAVQMAQAVHESARTGREVSIRVKDIARALGGIKGVD